jgi:hypothetical protein
MLAKRLAQRADFTVLPNSHFFTQIRVNSRNFTLFHEIFFYTGMDGTASNAQNSLSWAFSQKIFYFSYKRW